jgi:hypothetical protein
VRVSRESTPYIMGQEQKVVTPYIMGQIEYHINISLNSLRINYSTSQQQLTPEKRHGSCSPFCKGHKAKNCTGLQMYFTRILMYQLYIRLCPVNSLLFQL